MAEKYLMLNIDDEKTGKISEILKSKTCKNILSILAEQNLSESDIASKLKIPINTIEYNLKKLIDAGLVEKTKEFFWSAKGKKIPVYKAVRKSIVISPRSSTILKTVGLTGVVSLTAALILRGYQSLTQVYPINNVYDKVVSETASSAGQNASTLAGNLVSSPIWLWFLLGGIFTLMIFIILNWRKL